MTRLIRGVGTNDAGYAVSRSELIAGRWKAVWHCPFYSTWKRMIDRCYSSSFLAKNPNYTGCSVVPEWHRFSTFKVWMEQQPWVGNQLDKDLLVQGNKVYGPETCVFVSRQVNMFLVECTASRGEFPVGVCWDEDRQQFKARCNNPFTKGPEYLGLFPDPCTAHAAWKKRKYQLAQQLASAQSDERVALALLARYSNYKELPDGRF